MGRKDKMKIFVVGKGTFRELKVFKSGGFLFFRLRKEHREQFGITEDQIKKNRWQTEENGAVYCKVWIPIKFIYKSNSRPGFYRVYLPDNFTYTVLYAEGNDPVKKEIGKIRGDELAQFYDIIPDKKKKTQKQKSHLESLNIVGKEKEDVIVF